MVGNHVAYLKDAARHYWDPTDYSQNYSRQFAFL